MNESLFIELSARLTRAGLAGTHETDIFSMFCDRCVAAGIPLGRAYVAIDTLHPVHEGRQYYPQQLGRNKLAQEITELNSAWERGRF